MANIGFIRQDSYTFKDNDGVEKTAKWLECYFRVAGLRPFQAKMTKNKNKQNENAPDFFIYLRGNVNKGDSFRDLKIGALWVKSKIDESGVKVDYMTGNVEINFNEISVYITKPKKNYDDEKIGFLYEIISMSNKQDVKTNVYNEPYPAYNDSVEADNIEDDNIPF